MSASVCGAAGIMTDRAIYFAARSPTTTPNAVRCVLSAPKRGSKNALCADRRRRADKPQTALSGRSKKATEVGVTEFPPLGHGQPQYERTSSNPCGVKVITAAMKQSLKAARRCPRPRAVPPFARWTAFHRPRPGPVARRQGLPGLPDTPAGEGSPRSLSVEDFSPEIDFALANGFEEIATPICTHRNGDLAAAVIQLVNPPKRRTYDAAEAGKDLTCKILPQYKTSFKRVGFDTFAAKVHNQIELRMLKACKTPDNTASSVFLSFFKIGLFTFGGCICCR